MSDILVNPAGSGLEGEAFYKAIKQAVLSNVPSAIYFAKNYLPLLPQTYRQSIVQHIINSPETLDSILLDARRIMEFVPEHQRVGVLRKAAEASPENALFLAQKYMEFIPEDQRVGMLRKAAEASPENAIRSASHYFEYIPEDQKRPLLEAAIISAKDQSLALSHITEYQQLIDLTNSPVILEAIKKAARSDPQYALYNARFYGKLFDDPALMEELITEAVRKQPVTALEAAESFMRYIPAAKREPLILQAAESQLKAVLSTSHNFKDYVSPEKLRELVRRAAAKDHEGVILNLEELEISVSREDLTPLVREAADRILRRMQGRYSFYFESDSHAPRYLDNSTQEKLSALYVNRKNALKLGTLLNQNHNLPDSKRFEPINSFTSAQLYELLVLGREEMYTSTYAGVFNRLSSKLKSEGKNLFDVANPDYEQSVVLFIESSAENNRLKEAIAFIPNQRWEEILKRFDKEIETGSPSTVLALVEAMHAMPDPAIRKQMEAFVQHHFDHAKTKSTQNIYGVVAEYYNGIIGEQRIHTPTPGLYKVLVPEGVSPDALKGKDGIHRQLLVFPDDEDGSASFHNFMRRYRNNKKYKVEDSPEHVRIIPVNSAFPMEIYANKPGHSPDAIIRAIAGNEHASRQDVEIDALINRGHSYNLEDSLKYISKDNTLVYLGSCGGYSALETVMRLAPDMQPVSTKERGTMHVNDPLLYQINEIIRSGNPVVWRQVQTFLDDLASEDKTGYFLPHRNAGFMIGRKINELEALQEKTHRALHASVNESAPPAAPTIVPPHTPAVPQSITFLGP